MNEHDNGKGIFARLYVILMNVLLRVYVVSKDLLWPVLPEERKFAKLMVIKFVFVATIYAMVRNVKDSIVVANKAMGAGQTQFLKIFYVLPIAMVCTVWYSNLRQKYSRSVLFYCLLAFLNAIFLLFSWVLYPYADALCFDTDAYLIGGGALKNFLRGLLRPIGFWVYTLYYIAAEMWGVLPMFAFWEFANSVVIFEHAKRLYPVFTTLANLASFFLLMGYTYLLHIVCGMGKSDPLQWALFMKIVMILVGIFSFIIGICHHYSKEAAIDYQKSCAGGSGAPAKKAKQSYSFGESLSSIMSSGHLLCILVIVVSYGLGMGLVEVVFKQVLAEKSGNSSSGYSALMAIFQQYNALFTFLLALFGAKLLRKFGWFACALLTPVVLLITGSAFFTSYLFGGMWLEVAQALTLAVLFGTIQNVFVKSSKYSLFDATKEMSYLPLDSHLRSVGKGFIDVFGNKLGKGGGAAINTLLISLFGSIGHSVSCIWGIVLIMNMMWIFAVVKLRGYLKQAQQI